jgi:hypothetical protein
MSPTSSTKVPHNATPHSDETSENQTNIEPVAKRRDLPENKKRC